MYITRRSQLYRCRCLLSTQIFERLSVMSGSGGYSRYRCINFAAYECEHWIWVQGSACLNCIVSAPKQSSMRKHQLIKYRPNMKSNRQGVSRRPVGPWLWRVCGIG